MLVALLDLEMRYNSAEKIYLALVMVAKNLRPYFMSHFIVVMIKVPFG